MVALGRQLLAIGRKSNFLDAWPASPRARGPCYKGRVPRRSLASSALGRGLALLALFPLLGLAGCARWERVAEHEGWVLYARPQSEFDRAGLERALPPAMDLVEQRFGAFRRPVRVHAWSGGVELQSGIRGEIHDGREPVTLLEGIGPTKVRAFHARGRDNWLTPTGIFLGEADAGSAVHELVHARLAELEHAPPLWFEEGLATLLGDGALHEGRWVVDGFSYWHWRELAAQQLGPDEIGQLLALRSDREHSVRDNVLLHFVGWAIVYDAQRANPAGDWRAWLAHFEGPDGLEHARAALARTLADETPLAALELLDAPEVGTRLAAARGSWKLGRPDVFDRLHRALVAERDPEVRVALAVNLIAGAGDSSIGEQRWWRARRDVVRALRESELADPAERDAVQRLVRVYRGRSGPRDAGIALAALRRYWEE